jgi:hypothetical protein
MLEEIFIKTWIEAFGQTPVSPRTVLDYGIDHRPDFLSTIITVVDMEREHPHPDALAVWLSKNENRFILSQKEDKTYDIYRFSRFGRRWRLLPVPAQPAQPPEEMEIVNS